MTETLLQGDCLKLMSKLPDKAVDLVVTDPPYDVHAGKGGGAFGNRNSYKEIEFMSNGFNETVLDELMRVMKKTNIYIFCSKKQIPFLIDYFVHKHACNWNLLTWHKTNPVPACNNKYLSDTVLDNCMGSGSTGVAAKQLKRNFIGMELDKKYFEIAKQRINEA